MHNNSTSKKHLACSIFLLLLCYGTAWSQTVSGVVSDSLGSALPGTSVIIKGTAVGTTTDVNGAYTLSADNNLPSGSTIVFSFIGFKTKEVTYNNQTKLDIHLQEDQATLSEVVVTALGIKREEKELGFSTQKLDADQVNNARSNNWAASLSGKVAGLRMISSGSGPLNSTKITLRGDNSLSPDGNNALIVLDGVPMNSGMSSSGVTSAYGAGSGNDVPIDFGNGIADINPDDIESINVLKGAAATALYGSRAGNGAVIITTKSGARKGKGLGVTINSNYSINDILRWPDFQYEYGQGTSKQLNTDGQMFYSYGASADGANTGSTSSAFGPSFNGQMYYQYDPALEGQSAERTLWRPYKDNIKGFWRTGSTITNNISLEGGDDKNSIRASITHTKNEWIMPNTGYERIVGALSVNGKVSKSVKVNAKVNYTNKQSDNLPATGYNNQSISYFMIFQNPNVDLKWYEPRWKKDRYQIDQIHPFSSFIDNPYLIAYEMTNAVNSNAVVGSLSATYEISKKFELMVRSGLTMSQETREQSRPYSTANFQRGYFKSQKITYRESNSDFMLTYKDKLSDRIDVRVMAGANHMRQDLDEMNAAVDGLVAPGIYNLANGVTYAMITPVDRDKIINSVLGLATFSYSDMIFVDISGRNDWSSTLPATSRSYFYPAVSSSIVLSELVNLPRALSFAKLRLAVAGAGNDAQPYKTKKYYDPSGFPGSASSPTVIYNDNFKPELTTNYEAGLETMFFERRLGVDLTVYRNITKNQILDVPIDPTTGYSRAVINSGDVRNQGIELVLNGKPLKTKNLTWSTTVTWARNKNKVLSLADEMVSGQDIGYGGNATIRATVGGTTGDIWGYGFERAPDGQIIYTNDGLPARPDLIQHIGNAYADWKGGVLNEFIYKNLRFNFLIDGQYGGIIYSQTHHKMTEQGKLTHTLRGREEGYIVGNGVVDNGDGTYSPNTKQVNIADFYADYYRRANVESNSFDASFVKLREVRIEYKLPKLLLQRTPFSQVSLALYGRDLAMITGFPMFDPETAAMNGSQILPGVEIGQMPTPRTYGANVTLKL